MKDRIKFLITTMVLLGAFTAVVGASPSVETTGVAPSTNAQVELPAPGTTATIEPTATFTPTTDPTTPPEQPADPNPTVDPGTPPATHPAGVYYSQSGQPEPVYIGNNTWVAPGSSSQSQVTFGDGN